VTASTALHLRWRELPVEMLEALEGKLKGLYGATRDDMAFDNLAVDKQQALLLVTRRLRELDLWRQIRRVKNVYGVGGVGMNFSAWPELASALQSRRDFTTRFARHRDNQGGFIELGRNSASLHFLYTDAGERHWAVHFDLYNPWSSPLSAGRHLLYEKLRGVVPDWRTIRKALAG
jgi:hypothetical protein